MARRVSFEKMDKAVLTFAKNVVRDAKKNLTAEKAKATGALYNSIRFRWEAGRNTRTGVLRFFMNFYGAFIDKGVTGTGNLHHRDGKVTPVPYNKSEAKPEYKFKSTKKTIGGDLKQWLSIKGIPLSAEFPVKRSIHARGIRPRRFFTYAIERNLPKLEAVIGDALNADIDDYLDDILNE